MSATAVLAIYTSPTTSMLGLSSVIFTAVGLLLFERATGSTDDEVGNGTYNYVSANGSLARSNASSGPPREQQVAALRDIAAALMTLCGIASILTEPTIRDGIIWESVYKRTEHDSAASHDYQILWRILWMVLVHVITNFLLFLLVGRPLSFTCTSFLREYRNRWSPFGRHGWCPQGHSGMLDKCGFGTHIGGTCSSCY